MAEAYDIDPAPQDSPRQLQFSYFGSHIYKYKLTWARISQETQNNTMLITSSIINDTHKHLRSVYYEPATVLGQFSFNCDHDERHFKGEEFEA